MTMLKGNGKPDDLQTIIESGESVQQTLNQFSMRI